MSASPGGVTSILNFRDVGETVNNFLGQRKLKEGFFYRSARLDEATLGDRRALQHDIGIKSVIDLRTTTEHAKQVEKRQADLRVPALLESNATLAEPVQISGIKYHEIKITGGAFEKHLISHLSWISYLRLIFLYILGYRTAVIRIISQEVMIPRGLVGLGLDTMDQSGPEIATSLRTFVEPSALPILVHCTQGKDRTGLIVALILMILGIPIRAIEHDYQLTDEALLLDKEERLAAIEEIGLPKAWGSTDKAMITSIERHMDDKYGGLDGYLETIGFTKAEQTELRDLLLY